MEFFSPAKLNLRFALLAKRGDGYHEVETLIQAINLGDTLSLSRSEKDQFTCDLSILPTDSTNLVLRALQLFREKTGVRGGVTCHLTKKIPMEAGLGGGSSNAATMLYGLNALFSLSIPDEVLANWSSSLGTDAPFFFSEGRAVGKGRGEIVVSLREREERSMILAKPERGLSTPLVYQNVSLSSPFDRSSSFYNDLEVSAFELLPSLREIREKLLSLGFSSVHMTGSGTAFFCIGSPHHLSLPGVTFYPVSYLFRTPGSWYKFR